MSDQGHDDIAAASAEEAAEETPDEALERWHADGIARREERRRQVAVPRERDGATALKWLRRAGVVSAALLVLVAGVELATAAGRIHPGVRVGDVPVGGLSETAAETRILERVGPRLSAPVTVVHGDDEWTVDAASVAATLEPGPYVDGAFAVGRTGNVWTRLVQRATAWVGHVEIPLAATAEPEAVGGLADLVSGAIRVEPRDATITIDGTVAAISRAENGMDVVRDELHARVLKAFVSEVREVAVPTGTVPVEVVDADAEDALRDASSMLSGPATVTFEDKSWTFQPADIARWIVFEKRDRAEATSTPVVAPSRDGTLAAPPVRKVLVALIGEEPLAGIVTGSFGAVVVEPTDASFTVSNGVVSIVPHRDGTGPDVPKLAGDLTDALTTDGPRTVQLSTGRMEPEITTEKAKGMGIKERISTYTTSYSASNKPRVNNIHLLADALDGALIAPGDAFSFNEHVGPRTAVKGYKEAPAIVRKDGRLTLEPQLGGGICQVGTTIFNTVFFSGLPVVERRNHSFYIDHYPKGRDATVSWGGPDLKFRNDTPNWVLIKTAYTAGTVTISLYGTDPGYDIEYRTSEFSSVKPHGVVETKDPTLLVGSRVVEEGGVDGGVVTVTRVVKKGGAVVRTDTFKSVYKPKTEVIRVGTKPASAGVTGSPAPTSTP